MSSRAPNAERRAAISRLGADDVIDPGQTDPPGHVMRRTGNRGASAAYDAAGVEAAVEAALSSLGARRSLVSVAIYERRLTTTLLKLVMAERSIRGSLSYTANDFRSVIDLMAAGHYDTAGWVSHIALDQLIEEGFAALHAGRKMKLLVDL